MDNVEDDTNPHNPPDPPSLNNSDQKSNDDEPKSKSAKKKARRKQKARDTEKKSQKRRTSGRTASRPPSDDPPERPSREVDLVPQKTWPDRFEQPPDKPAKLLKKDYTTANKWRFIPGFDFKAEKFVRKGGWFESFDKRGFDANYVLQASRLVEYNDTTNRREESENEFFTKRITSGIKSWNQYLSQARRGKQRNPPGYLAIQPGYCNDHVDRQKWDPVSVAQDVFQPQGTYLCMNVATANMLTFMKGAGEEIAKLYMEGGGHKYFSINWKMKMNGLLKSVLPMKYWRTMKDLEVRNFDILETGRESETPYLVHLVRKDGCRDHCIGLMGDMIFDGCNDFTLTRTKENFDHACRPSKFDRILAVLEMCDDENAIQQIKDKEANTTKRQRLIAKNRNYQRQQRKKKKAILFRITLGKHCIRYKLASNQKS